MKRGHFGKSPKGKGSHHKPNGDKRRKSGGRGGGPGASPVGDGVAPRRNRSRSNGFQEFGNFLWTFDAATNHWVAKEADYDDAPTAVPASSSAVVDSRGSGHSKAALKELNEFGREFAAPHKGKKGRTNSINNGRKQKGGTKAKPHLIEDEDSEEIDADCGFVGFRSDRTSSDKMSPASSAGGSFMMRFVKGETMHDSRREKTTVDDEAPADGAIKAELKVEIKAQTQVEVEAEVKMQIQQQSEAVPDEERSRARPTRWLSEPAIPKFAPIVSPSRALGGMPATPQHQQSPFSGRGRGRGGAMVPHSGRGRGRGMSPNSPTAPVDFHWAYTDPTAALEAEADISVATTNGGNAEVTLVVKQEQPQQHPGSGASIVSVVATVDGGATTATISATSANPTSAMKATKKKEKKWKERQQKKNRQRGGFEPVESDEALFTTRDLVRARMRAAAVGLPGASARMQSSDEDEANAEADEAFLLFNRGGGETRKGMKKKQQKKLLKQQKKNSKKNHKVFAMDDSDSEDEDEMLLDDELVRDYLLNTDLSDLNLNEAEMEEHLLLHIVSQLNDYHLSDQDDDDDEDEEDEEEEDDDEDEEEEEGEEDEGDEDDDDDDEDEDDDEDDDDDDEDDDDEEDEDEDESDEDVYVSRRRGPQAAAQSKRKSTPLGLPAWGETETAVARASTEKQFDAVLNADFISLSTDRPPSFQQRLRGPAGRGGSASWSSSARDVARQRPPKGYSPGKQHYQHYQQQQQQQQQRRGRSKSGGRGKKGRWANDEDEFDEEAITDEEELPYIDRTRLKGKPRAPNGMITVHSINETIRNFIANEDKEWLELPPMNKKQRVMVHQLSELYHLKSKSYGSGRLRFPMLVKTIYTCYPQPNELLTFLNHAAKIKATQAAPPKPKLTKEESKRLRKLKHTRKHERVTGTVVLTKRMMDGQVVGEGADPLGQETIGARLLQSMGWTGGGLVGTNGEGIAEPLVAVVKNNRRGLGF